MSKYVRTEDGRIGRIIDSSINHIEYEDIIFYDNESDVVIKQANTIKELCDVFVITKNNEGIEFWKDFDALKQCSGRFIQNDFDDVYGAIWTDKGLIYVAIMNNKEDLELI